MRTLGFYAACIAIQILWSAVPSPSQDNVTLDDHVPGRVHLQQAQ